MHIIYILTFILFKNVVAEELNLALYKSAFQTLTYERNIANLSVDGNTNTESIAQGDINSLCWWQVDLGAVYDIMEIVIVNTLIGGSDSASTQYIFTTISLDPSTTYDESNTWSQNNQSIDPGKTFTMRKDPNSTASDSGRYITIWKYRKPPKVHNALTLAEVMVHGTLATTSTLTTPTSTTTTTTTTTTMPTTTTTPLTQPVIISMNPTPIPTTFLIKTPMETPITSVTTASEDRTTIKSSTGVTNHTTVIGSGNPAIDSQSSPGLTGEHKIILGSVLGVVGGLLLIGLIALLIFCLIRKKKKEKKKKKLAKISLKPMDTAKSIPLENIVSFVEENKRIIASEFASLPNEKVKKTTIGLRANDLNKNRYKNILPFDDNLIPLTIEQGDEPDDVYVNASFVKGYNGEDKAYIACQGPIKETITDMWRLIWQFRITNIVMLTQLIENAKEKSRQYWPETLDETETHDKISVTLTTENYYAHYVHRTFKVEKINQDFESPLIVTHMQFLSWIDKSRPDDFFPLFAFQRQVRKNRKNSNSPLLIHCSAGVGRTGSYVAIEILLEEARLEQKVSVNSCVTNLREQRMLMVQTQAQYEFVYDAMAEYTTFGDTAIQQSDFLTYFQNLTQFNRDVTNQFAMLETLRYVNEKSAGKSIVNKAKNRRSEIYASDDHRAYLPSVQGRGDYINAVFNNSYYVKNGLILTQTPLSSTIEDFWAMVVENGVESIILLEDINGDDESSPMYWPSGVGQSMKFGPYQIKLKSANLQKNLVLLNIEVTHIKRNSTTEIVMYKVVNSIWTNEIVPTKKDFIFQLSIIVSKNIAGKIVVQCSDGVTKCGLITSCFFLLQMMKVENIVDPFVAVRNVIKSRPQTVHNIMQYKFLYELAKERLSNLNVGSDSDIYINMNE